MRLFLFLRYLPNTLDLNIVKYSRKYFYLHPGNPFLYEIPTPEKTDTAKKDIHDNVANRDHIKAPKAERKEAKYLGNTGQQVIEALYKEPIKWRTALLGLLNI